MKAVTMQIPHLIIHADMTAWRQDLHAHPELGFEEDRTSAFVTGKLDEFGCEVHRNIGKTGVVGVLRTGNGPSIGLRADMDSLPVHEANDITYRSNDFNDAALPIGGSLFARVVEKGLAGLAK
jgi:metal-dependent amidase/aminoacylase/carboxypeptidase family protein